MLDWNGITVTNCSYGQGVDYLIIETMWIVSFFPYPKINDTWQNKKSVARVTKDRMIDNQSNRQPPL